MLISPNSGRDERIESEGAWPPLGLAYMGTVLERAGHEVRIIDNARAQLPDEKLIDLVRGESPNIVGISALTPTFRRALTIASAVKKACPDSKVVLGNYHATFEHERILRNCGFVDFVVLGEGEMTMLELANVLDNGGRVRDVRGISFRANGEIVRTKPRPPIQNLDELPFPDRKMLKEEYFSEVIGMRTSAGRFTTMVTSRGCPYGCRYCACSAFTSRTVRFRSPENVVEEMELLWSEGYEDVGFVDDNFLMNPRRVERICELIRERKIRMNLWVEGRTDQASLETMRRLARAGCRAIYFGIESGNEHVLKYYGKSITPEISRRAVSNARRARIDTVIGSFIVGAPIETRADVRKTLDFALSLKDMDFPQMNVLYLSPGMDLWKDAIERRYLSEEKFWDTAVPAVEAYPSHLTLEELEEMIGEFYSEFIGRKSYLVHQFLKTLRSRWRLGALARNIVEGRRFREALRHLRGD
ncbi:MAG: radical SAM protein [Candidatus Hadarchaeales archaeon]